MTDATQDQGAADAAPQTITVKAQTPGDSFTFEGVTYKTDEDGFVEAPVEAVAHIAAFGFFPGAPAAKAAAPAAKAKK